LKLITSKYFQFREELRELMMGGPESRERHAIVAPRVLFVKGRYVEVLKTADKGMLGLRRIFKGLTKQV
jgi:predicted Rossmann fold nucleotide-binding protein DprA/Smf involved in DNA uptake